MFTLDKLIVMKDDHIGNLIDNRACFYLDQSLSVPKVAYVSSDIYVRLHQEMGVSIRYHGPVPQGHVTLVYQTVAGTISFKVLNNFKNFLFVGTEEEYRQLEFEVGIPMELWGDGYRKKIDKEFEEIVLGVQC